MARVEAHRFFHLKTKKFLFSRSVTFDEEGLFSNLTTKVEHSHQNVNTNLVISLNISHRKEYKGPIPREQVRTLDEDATNQNEVTHYYHQILFKSSVRQYHPNQPSKDEGDGQQQQSLLDKLHEINEESLSTPYYHIITFF